MSICFLRKKKEDATQKTTIWQAFSKNGDFSIVSPFLFLCMYVCSLSWQSASDAVCQGVKVLSSDIFG